MVVICDCVLHPLQMKKQCRKMILKLREALFEWYLCKGPIYQQINNVEVYFAASISVWA